MEGRDRESLNGERLDKPGSSGVKPPTDRPPSRSGSSSSRSTPSLKTKDVSYKRKLCHLLQIQLMYFCCFLDG